MELVDLRLVLSAYERLAREAGVAFRFDAEVIGLQGDDRLIGTN